MKEHEEWKIHLSISKMSEMNPRHTSKCPAQRESYYETNGTEPEPAPWGEEILNSGGKLIYNYLPQNSVPFVC